MPAGSRLWHNFRMSNGIEPRALARFPLWNGLPNDLLQRIADVCQIVTVNSGQTLINTNSPSRGVFFLASGLLRIWRLTETGQEVLLGLVLPGGMFGERSIIDDAPHSANVTSLENSVLLRLPPEEAAQLFFHEPQIAHRLMRHLSALISASNAQREALTRSDATGRLWLILRNLAKPEPGNGLARVEPLPTQGALAQMSGLARETVSRLINTWVKEGRIERGQNWVVLRIQQGPKSSAPDAIAD